MGKKKGIKKGIEKIKITSKGAKYVNEAIFNISILLNVLLLIGNAFVKYIGEWWKGIIIVFGVVAIVILFRNRYLNCEKSKEKDKKLIKLNEELKEKDEELARRKSELDARDTELSKRIAELFARDVESAEKEKTINDLENKMKVFEKVLTGDIPVGAGYYMVNKPAYDKFRTGLYIRKCVLEVRLKEKEGKPQEGRTQEYNLAFKWKLWIKNNNSEPVREVHFIYSGEKEVDNVDKLPCITCKELGMKRTIRVDKGNEVEGIRVIGDDRFIKIFFENELKEGQTEEVDIEYVLTNYTYKSKEDTIWLVPDALGFTEMSQFYIRFIWNDMVNSEKTEVKLMRYKLSKNYTQEQSSVRNGSLENGDDYFEAEGDESIEPLHDYGYYLILTNKEGKS